MSNMDLSEAVRMLADHHGISVDALLQVLVEALATAYKKRPGAADASFRAQGPGRRPRPWPAPAAQPASVPTACWA